MNRMGTLRGAVTAGAFAILALAFAACSSRPGDSGSGSWRDFGREGEFTYKNGPGYETKVPPKPGPYSEPAGEFCYGGTCFQLYDTDGDGKVDWAWDPTKRKWYAWIANGGASESPDQLVDGGISDTDSSPPPAGWTAAECLAFHGVPISTDPEVGTAKVSARWETGSSLTESVADVTIHLRGSIEVDYPTNYGLRWEIFEIGRGEEVSYTCVRVIGDYSQVAGFMADMGFTDLQTQPDSEGNSYSVSVDPDSRWIYLDGVPVGRARYADPRLSTAGWNEIGSPSGIGHKRR